MESVGHRYRSTVAKESEPGRGVRQRSWSRCGTEVPELHISKTSRCGPPGIRTLNLRIKSSCSAPAHGAGVPSGSRERTRNDPKLRRCTRTKTHKYASSSRGWHSRTRIRAASVEPHGLLRISPVVIPVVGRGSALGTGCRSARPPPCSRWAPAIRDEAQRRDPTHDPSVLSTIGTLRRRAGRVPSADHSLELRAS